MRTAAQQEWLACKTLAELCAMGARRFSGEVDVAEGFSNLGITDDTLSIAKELAALNKAGFLTTQSQPGGEAVKGRGRVVQRAWVHGYTDMGRATWLDQECAGSIKVFVTPVWDALDHERPGDMGTTWTDKMVDDGELVAATFQVPSRKHHDAGGVFRGGCRHGVGPGAPAVGHAD